MASSGRSLLPFAPPTPMEAVALARAAAYLGRAGTEAASRLLGTWAVPDEAALLETLRDQLLAGAALCDGLLDLAADAGREAASRPDG